MAWYTRRKYRELEVGESPFILWIFFRGQVLTKAGTEETILYSDIDLKKLAEIRQQIPILKQKRADLYTVESKKP